MRATTAKTTEDNNQTAARALRPDALETAGSKPERPGRQAFGDRRPSSRAAAQLKAAIDGGSGQTAQMAKKNNIRQSPVQRKENKDVPPDNMKSGIKNFSGVDVSDIRVHKNSDKPKAVGALAYTQGTDIHIAPGQEKHLPHELGHVVQQIEGRVQPTTSVSGMPVNDNPGLEREADIMGEKAADSSGLYNNTPGYPEDKSVLTPVIQRKILLEVKREKDSGIDIYEEYKSDNEKDPKILKMMKSRDKYTFKNEQEMRDFAKKTDPESKSPECISDDDGFWDWSDPFWKSEFNFDPSDDDGLWDDWNPFANSTYDQDSKGDDELWSGGGEYKKLEKQEEYEPYKELGKQLVATYRLVKEAAVAIEKGKNREGVKAAAIGALNAALSTAQMLGGIPGVVEVGLGTIEFSPTVESGFQQIGSGLAEKTLNIAESKKMKGAKSKETKGLSKELKRKINETTTGGALKEKAREKFGSPKKVAKTIAGLAPFVSTIQNFAESVSLLSRSKDEWNTNKGRVIGYISSIVGITDDMIRKSDIDNFGDTLVKTANSKNFSRHKTRKLKEIIAKYHEKVSEFEKIALKWMKKHKDTAPLVVAEKMDNIPPGAAPPSS